MSSMFNIIAFLSSLSYSVQVGDCFIFFHILEKIDLRNTVDWISGKYLSVCVRA